MIKEEENCSWKGLKLQSLLNLRDKRRRKSFMKGIKIAIFINLRDKRSRKLFMNGTAMRQIETRIWVAPKNRSLLCDGSMNFDPKPGPDIKHAKVTPTALALHSNEMAWFPTPTWLKIENNSFDYKYQEVINKDLKVS